MLGVLLSALVGLELALGVAVVSVGYLVVVELAIADINEPLAAVDFAGSAAVLVAAGLLVVVLPVALLPVVDVKVT